MTAPKTRAAYSDYYERFDGPIGGEERFRWILQTFFPGSVSGQALEIGCGEGRLLERLAEKGARVVGIDVSESGVQKAQAKGLDCRLADLSREPLPWTDASLDLVVCLETIEHLENPYHCMMEIKRALHPGGRLLISIPNPAIGHPFCYPGLFDRRRFAEFLQQCGFRIGRTVGWGQADMAVVLQTRWKTSPARRHRIAAAVVHEIGRKRNKLLRHLGKHYGIRTPLGLSHCWNFDCELVDVSADPLVRVAEATHH